eukprot:ANDGO_04547.mRNA.1 hypothetical protein
MSRSVLSIHDLSPVQSPSHALTPTAGLSLQTRQGSSRKEFAMSSSSLRELGNSSASSSAAAATARGTATGTGTESVPVSSFGKSSRTAQVLDSELDRLRSFWSATRKDLSVHAHRLSMEHEREKSDVEDAREKLQIALEQSKIYKDGIEQLEAALAESNDKCRLHEMTLKSSKMENAFLREQVSTLKLELEKTQDTLGSHMSKYDIQSSQIAQLMSKLKGLSSETADKLAYALERNQVLESENVALLDEVTLLRQSSAEGERYKQQCVTMDRAMRACEVHMAQSVSAKEQVGELRETVRRLVGMLGKTREFAGLLWDGKAEIVFFGGGHTSAKRKTVISGSGSAKSEFIRSDWLPAEALNALRRFRDQHMPNVSVSAFSEMLTSLNQAFLERESHSVSRLKHKYKQQILDLKRQVGQRQPYSSVVYEERIQHLKKELEECKSSLDVRGDQREWLHKFGKLIERIQKLEKDNEFLEEQLQSHRAPEVELQDWAYADVALNRVLTEFAAARKHFAEYDPVQSQISEIVSQLEHLVSFVRVRRSDRDGALCSSRRIESASRSNTDDDQNGQSEGSEGSSHDLSDE